MSCKHTGMCKSAVACFLSGVCIEDDVKPLTRCAADRDGECCHVQCPQLRDNEPAKSGRHCPLDNEGDAA